MASFTYITPPGGFLQVLTDVNHYSQAVDLGNGFYKISGQGGFTEKGEMPSDIKDEVEQAFQNVEDVLKAAGLRGWEDVYYIRHYHTDMDVTLPLVTEALKKRIPNNRPGAVAAGVARLALPSMRIEIEVDAKKCSS
ncbi:hypothetical protein ACLX1H_005595 [Fusarium chlamydosporum]